jgi:transglutaminase-like putative cysteine protease/uncharacterized membrane protein
MLSVKRLILHLAKDAEASLVFGMVSTSPTFPSEASPGADRRALVPAEGWGIVFLHAIIVLIGTWSVQAAGWLERTALLPLVAIGATAFGFALAKSPAIDLLAHLLAFWLGLFVVWTLTAATFPELGADWRGRVLAVAERARAWTEVSARGEAVDDPYLFVGSLAFSVWLVAYMSAWILYRRQWVLPALGLPTVVVLANAGYQPDMVRWPLAVLLLATVMLMAAHFHYRRRRDWSSDQVIGPGTLHWRLLGIAMQIGLLAVVTAWLTPIGVREAAVDHLESRLEQPLDRLDSVAGDLFARFGGEGRDRTSSYAQFSDSFQLGGALNLTDDPVVLLQAATPAYLVAYRYDRWDGSGWESAVERTFSGRNSDGKRYSPQMRFAPGQPVALSDDVTNARAPVTGDITMLDADGNLLLTLDTYQSADVPTTVQLSWRTLDEARLPIEEPGALPPDLRHLAILLQNANAVGFAVSGDLAMTADQALNQDLLTERAQLRDRLIRVAWSAGEDGVADSIIVSGQLPVYDDVDAVFGRDDPTGMTYEVTGLASIASEEALRQAGQDYPQYVEDRYLQLPASTTFRTRALAARIVEDAGAANPFDQAITIQNHLRQRIRYEEQIDPPPAGKDAVDYVLFESQEGYCEYYASAMTVMLRSLGIPARIAVGYYPAAYDDAEAGFLYRQRNAHAWVETYFPSYGWIPFEPTASQPPRDYGANRLAESPRERPDTPTPEPTVASEPEPTATSAALPPATTDTTNDQSDQGTSGVIVKSLVAAIILALVGAFLIFMLWMRGLGGLGPIDAVWARVLKAGRWLGVRPDASMTPLEYADELGRSIPAARAPAGRLASLYTIEKYSTGTQGGQDGSAAIGAWRELRRTLTRSWAFRRLFRLGSRRRKGIRH